MPNYFFDGQAFPTKKAVDLHIREVRRRIIDDIGYTVIDRDNKYFKFCMEIVNNHMDKDEKTGDGIDFFYFTKDLFNNDQLRIRQVGGADMDLSCIFSKITKKNTRLSMLNFAMRHVIAGQIFEFRNSQQHLQRMKCIMCNCAGEEVDHIIPFSHLRDAFIRSCGSDIVPRHFNCLYNGLTEFREVDANFAAMWVDYHKENAQLQILCKKCNSKKGDKIS
jgi:hypothetical protein